MGGQVSAVRRRCVSLGSEFSTIEVTAGLLLSLVIEVVAVVVRGGVT